MRKRYRDICGICLLVVFVLLFGCTALSAYASKPESVLFSAGRRAAASLQYTLPDGWININDADAEELLSLPGIGETIAGNILTERQLNGPFYYPEDLLSVKGIGKVKLSQIREFLSFTLYDDKEIGE